MKKNVRMGLSLLILILVFTGCRPEVEPLKFATGSIGGVYYPLGSAISEVVSDNVDGVGINSYTGNASVSNSKLIASGAVDMALVQGNVAYWATQGIGAFEGEATDKIKGIASLYSETIQIVIRKDLNISTFEELKGMRVNIGPEGSGHNFDALTLIEAHGMTLDDFETFNYTFSQATEAFIKGELDATIITAGIPASSVLILSNDVEIELLNLSHEIINGLLGSQTYYTAEIVEASAYPFLESDVYTIATKALWVCSSDLSEELVYEMTKELWENIEDIKTVKSKSIEMDFSKALLGMSVEIHPGALRYYKEMESKQ